jgi:hypothetical protein
MSKYYYAPALRGLRPALLLEVDTPEQAQEYFTSLGDVEEYEEVSLVDLTRKNK